MKNNKGFTLIELLAVIIILAIIALIAVPTVTGIIDDAKKSSAIDSAYGYVDAVEKAAMSAMLTSSTDYSPLAGTYTVQTDGSLKCTTAGTDTSGNCTVSTTTISVDVKGEKPAKDGIVKVSNKKVIEVSLTFNGKTVTGNPSSSTKLVAS